MHILYIFFVLGLVLTACNGKKSPSEIPIQPKGNREIAGPFEPLMMKATADCAGFRRAFNYLRGRSFIKGDDGVVLKLKLAEDGQFKLVYDEFLQGNPFSQAKGVYSGSWKVEGEKLTLTGEARGSLKILKDKAVNAEIRIPGTAMLNEPRSFVLALHHEDNDSGITDCAPGEHPRIHQLGDGIQIGGKPALEFWSGRLGFEFDDQKATHANVGDWLDAVESGVRHRILLRVYASGVFTLEKQIETNGHREKKSEVGGNWSLKDGLIVLGDMGVIVPSREALAPVVYLRNGPGSGLNSLDKMIGINVGFTGY